MAGEGCPGQLGVVRQITRRKPRNVSKVEMAITMIAAIDRCLLRVYVIGPNALPFRRKAERGESRSSEEVVEAQQVQPPM